jgi:hypothetical protein
LLCLGREGLTRSLALLSGGVKGRVIVVLDGRPRRDGLVLESMHQKYSMTQRSSARGYGYGALTGSLSR